MPSEDWQSRSRATLAFAIAFSVIGLLITIGFAAIVIPRVARRLDRVSASSGSIEVTPMRRPPALTESAPTMSPPAAAVPRSGEMMLSESNADDADSSDNETTFVKTFALNDGAAFALKNINGSISISAWDQPNAELKAIQSGPDRRPRVFFTNDRQSLSIRTGASGGNEDLRYDIKLPRKLGRVELNLVNGSIKVSGVTGQIFIESVNGSIELNDVIGVSKIQTGNGKITATMQEASHWPMEFVTANGRIDVTIKFGFNAQLDASTVHGGINIDDQFGIPVQKEMVGQHARGQIGSGGPALKLTAINGSVKFSKQQ
jgi:DUF4097 and DUF4098 domain-containing protein YvlB